MLTQSRKGCLTTDCIYKNALFQFQAQAAVEYVPEGIELTPGYVGSAQLDISAFAGFGDLTVVIYLNGVVIGVVPEGNYPDLDTLGQAIADAINNGGSGYVGGYVGSGLISVQTPSPTTSANGFVIEIVINPTFIATANLFRGVAGQPIVVNDPTSPLYGLTILGYRDGSIWGIDIYDGLTNIGAISVANPGWPEAISADLMERFDTLDRIYTTGLSTGRYSYIKNDLTLFTNPTPPAYINSSPPIASNAYSTIEYNAINNTLYLGCKGAIGAANQVRMISSSGTMSTLGTITGGPTAMKANSSNGDMWYLGEPDIFIYDSANNLVQTIVGVAGVNPVSVEYCPDNDRMYVAFFDTVTPTNSYVRSYNATTYAVDAATFYSLGGNCFTMLYSDVFGVLFIQNSSGGSRKIDVVRLDGSLKQDITLTPTLSFIKILVEDKKNKRIVVVTTASSGETPTQITLLELTNEGTDVFDAAIEDGVDPTYTDGDTNCIDADDYSDLIQKLNKYCNACCGGVSSTPQVTITPSQGLFVIYFGNVTDNPVSAGDVTALGSVSQPNYLGTYSFAATSPSEYKAICIPASLGTPSRFYDVATNFDVAMQTSYPIVVNSIVYNVYVTFNALGGAITIGVQS